MEERTTLKRDFGHDISFRIGNHRGNDTVPNERDITNFAFGPFIRGKCRYVVDKQEAVNCLAGAGKRFANRVTYRDPATLRELAEFTDRFCATNFEGLQLDTDVSFRSWLSGRAGTYTERRIAELREMEQELSEYWESGDPRDATIGMFTKDESYGKPKLSRNIANVSDSFLIRTAPIAKLIEKQVFKHKSFVKNIPVRERAQHVLSHLGETGPFFANDFTSWEGLQTAELMLSLEFRVYRFFALQLGAIGKRWLKDMVDFDTMPRKYKAKLLQVWCDGKRKSGSCVTSLGNGINNFLLHAFFSEKYGWDSVGCFEGDDSVFNDPKGLIKEMFEKQGTSEDYNPWTQLGIATKLELHSEIGNTSFCGNVFDSMAPEITLTEPVGKLLEFAWLPKRYLPASFGMKMQLLRSKATSLACAYRGHPVLGSFSQMVLRLTRGYRIRKSIIDTMDSYSKEQYQNLTSSGDASWSYLEPPQHARFRVEELFGITIGEQRLLEKQFDEATHLGPIDLPLGMTEFVDPLDNYTKFWDTYVVPDLGQKKVVVPFNQSIQAVKDMRLLSRLCTNAADRSLLPNDFSYEDVWGVGDQQKQWREDARAVKDALRAIKRSI